MQKQSWRVGFAATFLLLAALPLAAKTRLEKITIVGPALAIPVELTDEETLRLSNPWYGKFIQWGAGTAEAPPAAPVYEVTLYARWRGSDVRPIYHFRYAPREGGQRGLVYLPGPGEPWHRENVAIIIRANHDGRWNLAGPAWDARLRTALNRKGQDKAAENDEMQRTKHGPNGASQLDLGVLRTSR
jgi:hypothetical protein